MICNGAYLLIPVTELRTSRFSIYSFIFKKNSIRGNIIKKWFNNTTDRILWSMIKLSANMHKAHFDMMIYNGAYFHFPVTELRTSKFSMLSNI
jgi:hypothetical protein